MDKYIQMTREYMMNLKPMSWLLVGAVFVGGIVTGIVFGGGFFFLFIFLGIVWAMSRQGAEVGEELMLPIKQEEGYRKIEKVERKAEIIREHIRQTNDLESKLELDELEKEIETIKDEYKIQ